MSHATPAALPVRPTRPDPAPLGASGWFITVLLALLLAGATINLWPQWLHHPDLSHGWFTPVVFVLLLQEARTHGTQRFIPTGTRALIAIGGALVAGLTLLAIGCLYAAALGWTHALVALVLTASLFFLLGAAWVTFALDSVRRLPFNWPAAVGLLLWLLSAPLPPGTYARLTGGLQLWVAEIVLSVLHGFGVVAVRTGNVIQLANTAVGVEEACSGVRSLLSCVYAGLFFSAVLVRRPWHRFLLIGLSAPLAIGMNLARSLLLTLLAWHGVDIGGAWHDVTGFAILAVTAAALAGLAVALGRGERRDAVPSAAHAKGPGRTAGSWPLLLRSPHARASRYVLAAGLSLAAMLVCTALGYSRVDRRAAETAPELASILPASPAGWLVTTPADLYRFSAQLHTDHLVQRTYTRDTADGQVQLTVYLAYWPPGAVPVSLVASHTPDACWPGAGWAAVPAAAAPPMLEIGGHLLTGAEQRLFVLEGYPQHVWYWHLSDGRPIQAGNVRSPRQLLLLGLRYGFQSDGAQLFVRVSSNRPWETVAAEALTQEIFARLTRFGL